MHRQEAAGLRSVDPAWYPGADVVDVVSADSYPTAGDHGPVAVTYDRELTLTGDTKVATLSEVGTIPDPDLPRAYQADWSYFVAWAGSEQDGTSNSLDFLKRVYSDPYVVTLDELGDFKHSGDPDTTAPTAPTGLAGTATASSALLSWTAATDDTGVTAYDVYRDGAKVGSTAGTAYTDTGLTASTAYSYSVRARDAAGNESAASAPAAVTTTAGTQNPGCTANYTTTSAWGTGVRRRRGPTVCGAGRVRPGRPRGRRSAPRVPG